MRMHKVKSFFLILLSSLCLIVVIVSCFIYLFNINNYSEWVSEQLKRATGYDIRFQMLENNWLTEGSFSVIGLSLYQQNQRIAYIDKLNVEIENLDLWSRQLAIKKLHLHGGEFDIRLPLSELSNNLSKPHSEQNQHTQTDDLAWQRIHLSHIQLTDFNVNVQYLGKVMLIEKASVDLQDVLLIDNKQFITLPDNINVATHINNIEFQDKSVDLALQDIKLSAKANLLVRQGELEVSIAKSQIDNVGYSPFLVHSLLIKSVMETNTLSLNHFSFDALSGHLFAQAEAVLSGNELSIPDLKIESIQLKTLNAHDMHILMPNFDSFDKQSKLETKQHKMPIESFVIEAMNLQNISLMSEAKIFPLTLKSADLLVNNFQVIKEGEFWNISTEMSKNADFSITFSQLYWQETMLEGFSLSGDLTATEQGLLNLLQ